MSLDLKAIRGMNDVLPADSARWRQLEQEITAVLDAYGYREIRLPLVELSAVFTRSIGDATDIVQKEMYSFDDRNGDNLTGIARRAAFLLLTLWSAVVVVVAVRRVAAEGIVVVFDIVLSVAVVGGVGIVVGVRIVVVVALPDRPWLRFRPFPAGWLAAPRHLRRWCL